MQARVNTYPMRTTDGLADDVPLRAMYYLTLIYPARNLAAIDLAVEEPHLMARRLDFMN